MLEFVEQIQEILMFVQFGHFTNYTLLAKPNNGFRKGVLLLALVDGAERAGEEAEITMGEVRKAMGLGRIF